MNIKIGKFNFVNSENTSLYLDDASFSDKFNYFFMDGKEDTIFVDKRDLFDNKNEDIGKYERELLKSHYILEYSSIVKNQINRFTRSKAMEMFKHNSYSRYYLYKDINIATIQYLENSKNCDFTFRKSITNDNKLILHADYSYNVVFEPYSEKVENLEELYEQGIFNKEIKANLILIEIENGIAPKYIEELYKIHNFFDNKKTVNILCNGFEKFKAKAELDSLFGLRDNEITINLDRDSDFQAKNPSKKEEELKPELLKEITYLNKKYIVNGNNFLDIPNQIAITLEDRVSYKLDQLKNELSQEFVRQKIKIEFENRGSYIKVPSTIEQATSIIKEKNTWNEKNIYPEWFNKEMKELLQKQDLLNSLIENKGKEEFIDIGYELAHRCKDKELKAIVDEYEANKEEYLRNYENSEEEEEL